MLYVDAHGARIPALGFGTFQLEGRACHDATLLALRAGYRHIDTAQMYGNEADVGQAIRDSAIRRDRLWVTTKIAPGNLAPENVAKSTQESVKRLAMPYVDLLLIHWPDREIPLADTLGAMMRLVEDGLARRIGVSNFTPRLMEEALTIAPVICNQVEYHPFLQSQPLLRIARDSDTALVAYSPLARGKVMEEAALREIGERHGKSAAQVTLRWQLQQQAVATIPKATTRDHIESNFAIFDFELSDEEMTAIADLDRGERLIDPPQAPEWGEAAPPELQERRRRKLTTDKQRTAKSQIADNQWVPDAPPNRPGP